MPEQLILPFNYDSRAAIGISGKRWRKVTSEEVKHWVTLSNQGLTTRAIERMCGRDHQVVRKWLRRAGVADSQIKHNEHQAQVNKIAGIARTRSHKGIARRHTSLSKFIYGILSNARVRARKQSVAFDLDLAYALGLYEQQSGLCALTGLEMSLEAEKRGRSRPFVPSLDRIAPARGYVKGNVRFVCWAVNLALSQWGEDQFLSICQEFVRRHGANQDQ